MKKYSAQYVPVPGEIKYGDKYINKVFKLTDYYKDGKGKYETCGDYLVETRKPHQTGTRTFSGRDEYKSKVQLFLCSRDIQVGDKVLDEDYCEWIVVESDLKNLNPLTKVIGQISPQATWVKAGDEFDEDEVRLMKAIKVKYSTRAHGGEDTIILGSEDSYSEDELQESLEYWCERPNQFGIQSAKGVGDIFINHIEIKGPCGHFH